MQSSQCMRFKRTTDQSGIKNSSCRKKTFASMGIFLTVNYKVISNDTEHDKFVKNPAVGTFGAFDLVCFSTQILH